MIYHPVKLLNESNSLCALLLLIAQVASLQISRRQGWFLVLIGTHRTEMIWIKITRGSHVSPEQTSQYQAWRQLTCCISFQETASKGDSCCSRACPHLCQPEKLLFKNLSLTTESKEPDYYIRSDPKGHLAQWSSPVTVNNNHLKSFKKYQPSVKRDQQIPKD